jgi:hypothetical protein
MRKFGMGRDPSILSLMDFAIEMSAEFEDLMISSSTGSLPSTLTELHAEDPETDWLINLCVALVYRTTPNNSLGYSISLAVVNGWIASQYISGFTYVQTNAIVCNCKFTTSRTRLRVTYLNIFNRPWSFRSVFRNGK